MNKFRLLAQIVNLVYGITKVDGSGYNRTVQITDTKSKVGGAITITFIVGLISYVLFFPDFCVIRLSPSLFTSQGRIWLTQQTFQSNLRYQQALPEAKDWYLPGVSQFIGEPS